MENNLINPRHLVQDHGLLKTFNLNRKVTQQEINKIANSMGMDVNKIDFDDIHSIVSTISNIEYSYGEVPGTVNSNSEGIFQTGKGNKKLNKLIHFSTCILDLLEEEKLSLNEKIFIINKCLTDLDPKNKF
jgi:uncharacterized protein YpuA (DUF1002 family)